MTSHIKYSEFSLQYISIDNTFVLQKNLQFTVPPRACKLWRDNNRTAFGHVYCTLRVRFLN